MLRGMGLPVVLSAPLTVWRGDKYSVRIEAVDDTGAAYDLSGFGGDWTAAVRLRPSGELVCQFTVETDLPAGLVTLRLTKDDTRLLNGAVYGFDVQTDTDPADPYGPTTIVAGRIQAGGDYAP
jgi:hypothetical protein